MRLQYLYVQVCMCVCARASYMQAFRGITQPKAAITHRELAGASRRNLTSYAAVLGDYKQAVLSLYKAAHWFRSVPGLYTPVQPRFYWRECNWLPGAIN